VPLRCLYLPIKGGQDVEDLTARLTPALKDGELGVYRVYTKDWGKACFVVLGMEVIRTVR
jgi:hypothetical protein